MADLDLEIRNMLDEGLTPARISTLLDIPMQMVYDIVDAQTADDSHYDESMDGDFDSAMASAGFGTDEDYGYYGEEEE
jgi:NAD-specific glutamate dehydrogenase